jgi:hypothetical protein
VTKGVFSFTTPPEFTDDELSRLRACLGDQITSETLMQAMELRRVYFNFVSTQEQMATVADANALRFCWAGLMQSVKEVILSTNREGIHARGNRALCQLLGADYISAVGDLMDAAARLQISVGEELKDDANIADIRSGHAAGLRAVLWFLHEPVEGGARRGKSLGLVMGPGSGRGAPKLHKFLSVITSRRISGDDVKNAIDYLKKHDEMPKPGNRPSSFGAAITEFPKVW